MLHNVFKNAAKKLRRDPLYDYVYLVNPHKVMKQIVFYMYRARYSSRTRTFTNKNPQNILNSSFDNS